MMFKSKQRELHSRYYWLLIGVCVLIGLPVAFWLYVVISDNVSGHTRIPVLLLLVPLMVLLVLTNWIDARILKAAPQLVCQRDRAALAAVLGYDPVSGQPTAHAGQYGQRPSPVGAVPSGNGAQPPTSYGR